MLFKEVIGQSIVKNRLIRQYREGRGPHALLLSGPEGCGKLAMAWSLAGYLLCRQPGDEDACGVCPACRRVKKLGHPDLHFSFPVIRKSESTTCNDYLEEWSRMLQQGAYFGLSDWIDQISSEAKSPIIPDAEGDNILNQMMVTSYEGGYKVLVMWLPERMTSSAANNLLKFLEEPTPKTVAILVSDHPDQILPTILSRTQQVEMFRLSDAEVAEALESRNGLDTSTARQVARIAGGSYLAALRYIQIDNATDEFFEQFVALMRMAYARDVMGLQRWTDKISAWNRERQKMFLGYAQNMIRENFVYNFRRPELNYMNDREAAFALKFAKFINERNVVGFMEELGHVQKDIEQNVNARTVFFDAALRITILLRK